MKPRRICLLFLLACLAICIIQSGPGFAANADAYRIVNVADDFQAYYQSGRDKDSNQRLALWDAMLESKHPVFFQDAIYRRKTGADRDRYKQDCINRFWDEVAPHMDRIAAFNQGIEERIQTVVAEFKKHLPGFSPQTDFFVTISFSFRGKAVTVGGRDVLAVGLEFFENPDSPQFEITLAHELFHLYHFQFFSAGGGLYRSLWAEGLATYASAVVVPGHRQSTYLGFTGQKMNQCYDLLPLLAADLRKHMGENDHRLQRLYFGAEPNNTKVPPEAGYYVGLLIIQNLANKIPLDDMARMPAKQVFGLLEKELAQLEQQR
jgi:hypothetical protein